MVGALSNMTIEQQQTGLVERDGRFRVGVARVGWSMGVAWLGDP